MAMSVMVPVTVVLVTVAGLSFGRAVQIGVFVMMSFQSIAKLCLRRDLGSIPGLERQERRERANWLSRIPMILSRCEAKRCRKGW